MHECREPEGNSPQFKLHLESCSTAVVGQWERKFAVWRLTQLQVNSMVRLFPDFKKKKKKKPEKKKEGKKGPHLFTLGNYRSVSGPCIRGCSDRSRSVLAVPEGSSGTMPEAAQIETKLPLLRVLFTVPKH